MANRDVDRIAGSSRSTRYRRRKMYKEMFPKWKTFSQAVQADAHFGMESIASTSNAASIEVINENQLDEVHDLSIHENIPQFIGLLKVSQTEMINRMEPVIYHSVKTDSLETSDHISTNVQLPSSEATFPMDNFGKRKRKPVVFSDFTDEKENTPPNPILSVDFDYSPPPPKLQNMSLADRDRYDSSMVASTSACSPTGLLAGHISSDTKKKIASSYKFDVNDDMPIASSSMIPNNTRSAEQAGHSNCCDCEKMYEAMKQMYSNLMEQVVAMRSEMTTLRHAVTAQNCMTDSHASRIPHEDNGAVGSAERKTVRR